MNDAFSWIPFYMELADKLLEYKDNRTELINKIKKVYSDIGISLPTLEKKGMDIIDIDPFTIFGLFNKGITSENRISIISGMKKEFGVSANVPESFEGIPVINNMSATFYYFIDEREDADIDNLWGLFVNAIEYASSKSDTARDLFVSCYNKVLKQQGVRWNITMGLFWIRPYTYLNLDTTNQHNITDDEQSPLYTLFEKKLTQVPDGKKYLDICQKANKLLSSSALEKKNFPAFSYYAWLKLKSNNSDLEGAGKDITVEQWIALINDKNVFNEKSLHVMSCFKEIGGEATLTELENRFGNDKNYYNKVSSSLAKRVAEKLDLPITIRESGLPKYWDVLFSGREAPKEASGSFYWKLYDNLSEALEKTGNVRTDVTVPLPDEKNDYPLLSNAWLLTWNPKVWEWKDLDEAINCTKSGTAYVTGWRCMNTKVKEGDRVFMLKQGEKPRGIFATGYAISGTSDKYADIILTNITDFRKNEIILQDLLMQQYPSQNWSPQGSGIEIKKDAANGLLKLWNNKFETTQTPINPHEKKSSDQIHKSENKKYTKSDFLAEVFMSENEYDTIVSLLIKKKNIILQGAPGVGKTFAAKRLAYSMIGEQNSGRVKMIQFHQSYSYEDFIMGYRPTADGFELKKGTFYNFCKEAEIDSENDYFFIIDEINRGNLSKIFGELFMLIESDKRRMSLQLLYSDEKFSVPENVYIIGMMNTADRSLAMLDYALRRRFAFVDMKPGFDTDGFKNYQTGIGNEKFNRLIKCICQLNDVIRDDESLGEGFCIGHSFFCGLDSDVSDDVLRSIVEHEIIQLLKEYWYDEPQKVKEWRSRLLEVVK